jgi:hypothetical protein
MLNVDSFFLFVQFYHGACQFHYQGLFVTNVPEDLEGHLRAEVPTLSLRGSFSHRGKWGRLRCGHVGPRFGPTRVSSLTC